MGSQWKQLLDYFKTLGLGDDFVTAIEKDCPSEDVLHAVINFGKKKTISARSDFLSSQLDSAKFNLFRLEAQVMQERAANATKAEEIAELQAEIKALKASSSESNSNDSGLACLLSECNNCQLKHNQVELLNNDLSMLRSHVKSVELQLENALATIPTVESRANHAEELNKKLDADLNAARKEVEFYKNEVVKANQYVRQFCPPANRRPETIQWQNVGDVQQHQLQQQATSQQQQLQQAPCQQQQLPPYASLLDQQQRMQNSVTTVNNMVPQPPQQQQQQQLQQQQIQQNAHRSTLPRTAISWAP